MTVLDETVEFQVFDYLPYSVGSLNCFHVDIVDSMVDEEFTQKELDELLELERELEVDENGKKVDAEEPEANLGVDQKQK
ncbi:hypothetical protein ACOSQ2_014098 [Xanthoceras sorbifolium]